MSASAPNSTSSWDPPIAAEQRNYPYNCWWVAGLSSQIGRELVGRWLLDTPVLLYRKEDGSPVAIEDRCPHRAAPLSLGTLRGDDVQCGYHGFTFSSDGRCLRVPSMISPPAAARVRSFPVIEQGPFIWIYLGDPDRIEEAPLPHVLEWADDPSFAKVEGIMELAANYMLLKENVLDLTHFGYVHASSFKITDWVDPPRFTTEGDIVSYHQSFSRSALPPVFAEPLGIAPGTPYDRENYGSFISPALQIAAVDLIDPENGTITGRFRVTHATTPIDATHMLYFWIVARDFGTGPEQMARIEAITKIGFAEDEAIIEAVQRVMTRDPRSNRTREISVKMDTAAVQARRIVQRWMEREIA